MIQTASASSVNVVNPVGVVNCVVTRFCSARLRCGIEKTRPCLCWSSSGQKPQDVCKMMPSLRLRGGGFGNTGLRGVRLRRGDGFGSLVLGTVLAGSVLLRDVLAGSVLLGSVLLRGVLAGSVLLRGVDRVGRVALGGFRHDKLIDALPSQYDPHTDHSRAQMKQPVHEQSKP